MTDVFYPDSLWFNFFVIHGTQDAEGITISDFFFDQVGGNGVMFSNHVENSAVTDSEFKWTGDSAVAFLGSTVSIDGSAPTYPNKNLVARNHMHEVGVYGKQTSCFAQQLSSNSTILDVGVSEGWRFSSVLRAFLALSRQNVCYNGPRAGINYNDGFGGNNKFASNAVWNMVRETGDHGPLNSWDRQPYWTFRYGRGRGFFVVLVRVRAYPSHFVCVVGSTTVSMTHLVDLLSALKITMRRTSVRAPRDSQSSFCVYTTLVTYAVLNGYNGVWTFDQ